MRCPWCGNSVMIHGAVWECNWCGEYGSMNMAPMQMPFRNKPSSSITITFVYRVDLPETWGELKKALGQLAPGNTLLSQLLGRVLLHNISAGIQHAGALQDEEKAEKLRTFLTTTADLNLGKGAEEIMQGAKQDILFREEAFLSETECGSFWTELLSARPAEDYYSRYEPDGLPELFSELSAAYAYFGGKKEEESGDAQDYRNALKEAYDIHWQNRALLHPDAERAKRLLAQGEFPGCEDICREILLVEYPEEVPHENAEDFEELSWESILDDVFAGNTDKGIEMWRRLLDIAEPSLKTSPKTAEKLLPDWDWLDSPSDDQVLSLMIALEDERFASQLFESASIGRMQCDVLTACRICGQEELGQHCLELALKNPYLKENWEKGLRRASTATPPPRTAKPRPAAVEKPLADTKSMDGTVYHYCSVQVQGTHRPYAYLTGGLPLKAGDWVELPYGKDDVLRRGQVKAVMDCTRRDAPWPPELTKSVIRTIDAPAAAPSSEAAAPKPQKRTERPENKAEKAEKPEQPETKAEAQIAEAAVPEAEEKKPAPTKKPFPFKKLIAAILAAAAVTYASAAYLNYSIQRSSAYESAIQEMANGDYAAAKRSFSHLSGYRDAESLSIYCKYAGIYENRAYYAGGQDELSKIELKYDTGWQQAVDALEFRVNGYKAEKDAADEADRERIEAEKAARLERQMSEKYSGKLPVDGMPASCLKYTSIGEPTKIEKCKLYDNMDVHRRYKIMYWYNSEGQIVAYCHSHQPKGETEEIIYAFTYYATPIGRPNSAPPLPPPGTSGGSNSGSLWNDYDNPEDLWEDNPDWYEDEDEAWDEWENG